MGGTGMSTRAGRGEGTGKVRFVGIVPGLSLMLMVSAAVAVWGSGPSGRGGPLKVVVHVNFAHAGRQGQGLKNVENILKQATAEGLGTDVEVVCHADGITLLEKSKSEHAGHV